jgi:hypothetical protein
VPGSSAHTFGQSRKPFGTEQNGCEQFGTALLFIHFSSHQGFSTRFYNYLFIFPIFKLKLKDHNNIEEAKEEIARFNRLFPLLLQHLDQLFIVSNELIQTFDATLMSQVIEEQNTTAISGNGNTSNFSSTASPFLVCFGLNLIRNLNLY